MTCSLLPILAGEKDDTSFTAYWGDYIYFGTADGDHLDLDKRYWYMQWTKTSDPICDGKDDEETFEEADDIGSGGSNRKCFVKPSGFIFMYDNSGLSGGGWPLYVHKNPNEEITS